MITPIMPTYAPSNLVFERGDGAYLFTPDGTPYLDFGAGIAVTTLGHSHPHLVKALTDQASKLLHTSNLYQIPNQQRAAERLVDVTFADTVFFSNSGAEALECAIKVARRYHWTNGAKNRYRVITFDGAFHGRTLATLAAGGQQKHLEGFAPAVDGFDQVPYGDIDATNHAITEKTAAILLEPIQGEGGIITPPSDFLACIRDLCDAHGILMLLDEVQTGIGRTSDLFAYQASGVEPDVLSTAKALGGGFPVGACLVTEEAAKGMVAGTHGSTFGGNPMAMAAVNAVLDIVLDDDFLPQVRESANTLRTGLEKLIASYPNVFTDLRGRGLMIGLGCKLPNTDVVKQVIAEKMLVVPAGDNTIRLLPPLNITQSDIDEALTRLDKACQALSKT